MALKVVTINILSDLSLWEIRRELLVNQLIDLSPDIITVQEVALPVNPTIWLADQLNLRSLGSDRYEVYLCPKNGSWGRQEGIAILSRLSVKTYENLSLCGQGRVAQKIQIDLDNESVYIVNVHLFWQPGHSETRRQQIGILIQWLDRTTRNLPVVACGDFNDIPDSEAIRLMKSRYESAYNLIHCEEPSFTFPTPLPVSAKFKLKTILRFAPYIRLRSIKLDRRFTLDYIFVNHKINVHDAQLILNKSHSTRFNIYPSDHFGLFAELTSN